MSDFGFKVGTSIGEVKNLAQKAKVSEDVQKLIFDFCDGDLDEVVTDDIELHILNTWFSNQKKVKMPDKFTNLLSRLYNNAKSLLGLDNFYSNTFVNKKGHKCTYITTELHTGETVSAHVWDKDGDGYVDTYINFEYDKNNKIKGDRSIDFEN